MKDTKRRLESFSFYDRTELERHLVRMAEKGWMLEKIGNFLWTYRRIEPKALTFSVCYFPKASAFDPGPSEEQETFYDFCAHTGWELAASNAQLQVFYNERPDPIPIDTDPMMEVDAIHRSVKRTTLPSQLVLLALAILNGALFVSRLLGDPIGVLASAANLFTGLCWVTLILLTGVEAIGYFVWHHRAVRAAERGEFYQSKSHRKLQIGCLVVVMVGLVYYLLSVFTSGDRMMIVIMLIMFCIYTPGLFLLTYGVKGFLKRRKVSARVNRTVTISAVFVAAYAVGGVLIFGVLFGSTRGWFAGDDDTYQYRGETFVAYLDELPLTVEDLTGTEYEDDSYIRQRRVEQSILLEQFEMKQRPRFDAADFKEMPQLEYTITLVKVPALYGLCRDSLLNQWDDDNYYGGRITYVPTDAAPWGAVEAYRENDAEFGPRNQYLLCYEDRIVEIQLHYGWGEITPEQMALVGERLGQVKL